MTASQPQIRTVHQLQNMLSLFWKNVNSNYVKIPSNYIRTLFKKKEWKASSKNWKISEFTKLANIVQIHWKPPILLQSNTKKNPENIPVVKADKQSCLPQKVESAEILEFDKALTEWVNDDRQIDENLLPQVSGSSSGVVKSKPISSMKGNLEKTLSSWLQRDTLNTGLQTLKNWVVAQKGENSFTYKITKSNVESRSRFLVKSLLTASSETSLLYRLQEMGKHLLKYPDQKDVMIKENAIPVIIRIRQSSSDVVQAEAQEILSLLGYSDPPGGAGIRILSIDGGGIRGMIAIEILRHLEKATGKPVNQLFDYICGVSTGAILTMLVGGLHLPMDECEKLYVEMSRELFKRSAFLGTSGLLWSQSYYDTNMWVSMLRKIYGELTLSETMNKKGNPKISCVSVVMNQPVLQAFAFRNYAFPYRKQSLYPGSCNHKLWQAIRASAAAPGYFEQYILDGLAHQDGGLIMNNPTALAVHEARLLWPKESIQCVLSLGNGRFIPGPHKAGAPTGLTTVMMKVLDSATDTESFHAVLQDHLPSNVYFRINPYMKERISLDEIRTEKLEQLKRDAQKYIDWNEEKIQQAVQALTKRRSKLQKLRDWIKLQSLLHQKSFKSSFL
nr:calcium-independent phospholipase A2 [Hemiscorpius lepturus]